MTPPPKGIEEDAARHGFVSGTRKFKRTHRVAGLQGVHLGGDDLLGRSTRLWPSDVGFRCLEKAAVLGSQRCGTMPDRRPRRERIDARDGEQQRTAVPESHC